MAEKKTNDIIKPVCLSRDQRTCPPPARLRIISQTSSVKGVRVRDREILFLLCPRSLLLTDLGQFPNL